MKCSLRQRRKSKTKRRSWKTYTQPTNPSPDSARKGTRVKPHTRRETHVTSQKHDGREETARNSHTPTDWPAWKKRAAPRDTQPSKAGTGQSGKSAPAHGSTVRGGSLRRRLRNRGIGGRQGQRGWGRRGRQAGLGGPNLHFQRSAGGPSVAALAVGGELVRPRVGPGCAPTRENQCVAGQNGRHALLKRGFHTKAKCAGTEGLALTAPLLGPGCPLRTRGPRTGASRPVRASRGGRAVPPGVWMSGGGGRRPELTLQWMTTTCWGSLSSQDSCALQMAHTLSSGGACSSGQPTSRICNERVRCPTPVQVRALGGPGQMQ